MPSGTDIAVRSCCGKFREKELKHSAMKILSIFRKIWKACFYSGQASLSSFHTLYNIFFFFQKILFFIFETSVDLIYDILIYLDIEGGWKVLINTAMVGWIYLHVSSEYGVTEKLVDLEGMCISIIFWANYAKNVSYQAKLANWLRWFDGVRIGWHVAWEHHHYQG